MAPRCADKERTAFLKMCDMLTGKIAVGQKTTAVLISFQSLIVERGKQLIFVDLRPDCGGELIKKAHPGIEVGGAVIRMNHGDRIACRRRHHIDLRITGAELFFQNQHCKHRGSGGNITRTLTHAVGGCHAGSGVSLRRT